MLGRFARVAFLATLAIVIAAWAVSVANSSQVEPQYDPTVHWIA